MFNGQCEQEDEDNEPMGGRQYSDNVTMTMTKMRCCVDDVTNIQDIVLPWSQIITLPLHKADSHPNP